jgi:hypothetical protein
MGKTNSKIEKNLNREIYKTLDIPKNSKNIESFKNGLKGRLKDQLNKSNLSNLSNLPVNTKRIFKLTNNMLDQIYTNVEKNNPNFYNTYFLYNVVGPENENFISEKLIGLDNMISTENIRAMQLNISRINESLINSNLDMSYRSRSEDRTLVLETIDIDRSKDESEYKFTDSRIGKSTNKSRSKSKVKYSKPPKVNIKMNIKDLIKEDIIENTIIKEKKEVRKNSKLNITNISKINTSVNHNDASFVDIIDILAQTDLSYKDALRKRKQKQKNKY